jgi:hypothetical protein
MKIITENDVIIQGGENGKYSNAFGDKIKGLVGSGKVKGFLEKLSGGGAGGSTPSDTIASGEMNSAPLTKPAKKGMSTGAKVGIAVGAILVITGIWYFGFHKKKAGK